MNKNALKKSAWTHVRIRPIAKRFFGADGSQLPPVDDDWQVQTVEDNGLFIRNTAVGHGTILGFDQMHHFSTDPARGQGYGFLTLNVQVNFGGDSLWIEPTFRPGEALPDQFGSVRAWKRENDVSYLQSLFSNTQPIPLPVALRNENQALRFGLFVGLLVGVGLLVSDYNVACRVRLIARGL